MNDTQLKSVGGEKAFFLKPETYELIRTAARGTIIPDEAHFSMERRGNQTFFSLLNPGGAVTAHPFRVTNASTEELCRVYVQPGMVSGPYITATTPDNMVLDDSVDVDKLYFTITAAASYICLKITITTGEEPVVSPIEVELLTTVPADTDTDARLVLAVVSSAVVGEERTITSIFQNVKSNLLHSLAFEGYSYPDYWRQMIGPISPAL